MKIDPDSKTIHILSGTLVIHSVADWPVQAHVKGRRIDATGWTLDATKHPDNKLPVDSEKRVPALRIKADGITLKGLRVEGSPNGVVVSAQKVTLWKCSFARIGEDALNPIEADDLTVKECRFLAPASDKMLQANRCQNLMIRGCHFGKCINAIRAMGTRITLLTGCTFDGPDTAIHVTKKGVSVMPTGCKFIGVRQQLKMETGGKFV